MPRRGANIYRRKDGRWEGRIIKEGNGGGGRKYISIYGKTYKEAKRKMEAARQSRKENRPPGECTLGEAAASWLLEKKPCWKQTTYASYRQTTDKYILPKLGHLPVGAVDGAVLEEFLAQIRKGKNGAGLSLRYLRNICGTVLRIMRFIKKRKHYEMEIPENPVPSVKGAGRILPKEQEMALLEKYLLLHENDGTCLGILTALYTGMRIGEICALKWGDIDLAEGIIYVRRNLQRTRVSADGQKNSTQILFQTPKTGASLREVPIPPVLLSLLRKRKEEKDAYIIKGKKRSWAEPRTLQYRFAGILGRCGIERFNFHMLRHAFATRCIASGFDVKSLSEILGHSSIQVTLSLYVHSDMQRKKGLMGRFTCSMYQETVSQRAL